MLLSRGRGLGWCVVLMGLALAGCGTRMTKAPVEDRGTAATVPVQTAEVVPAKPPMPGAENAGKVGYYTVKPGDTLIRIGLDTGQSWKDIARWNNLDNPNLIEVGQVLRVQPPGAAVVASPESSGVVTRPVASSTVAPAPAAVPAKPAASGAAPAAAAASAASAPTPAPAPAPAPVATGPEDDMGFIWPAGGQVLCRCGLSKDKPWCDASHRGAGFEAPRCAAAAAAPQTRVSRTVAIQPVADGPLVVHGTVDLTDRDGALISRETGPTLCRCGHSANKPYCDGSHARVGFCAPE